MVGVESEGDRELDPIRRPAPLIPQMKSHFVQSFIESHQIQPWSSAPPPPEKKFEPSQPLILKSLVTPLVDNKNWSTLLSLLIVN